MRRICLLLTILSFGLLCFAGVGSALELLAPQANTVVDSGKVSFIGRGGGESTRGMLAWEGRNTGFRVKDGHFNITVQMEKGHYDVALTVGEETLNLALNVGTGEGKKFAYHPKVLDGECEVCHEPNSPPPSETDISGVCYECHSDYRLRKYVHGPVAYGVCATCHDPHGSVRPSFIKFELQEMCTYCHNQPITADHRKASGKGQLCIECHNAHGSNMEFHLKRR